VTPQSGRDQFAQRRKRAGISCRRQIFIAPLKIRFVREHRQARRAASRVSFGKLAGHKISADQSFAGAGFFNLGNQRNAATCYLAAQRFFKPANRQLLLRQLLKPHERHQRPARRYMLKFMSANSRKRRDHSPLLAQDINKTNYSLSGN